MKAKKSAISCIEMILNHLSITTESNSVELFFDISSHGSVLNCFTATCSLYGIIAMVGENTFSSLTVNLPIVIYNSERFFILKEEINDTQYLIYDPLSSEKIVSQRDLIELNKSESFVTITFQKAVTTCSPLIKTAKVNESIDPIMTECRKFISECYPDCYASGLTGSYSEKKNHADSDVDLLIISESHYNVVKETIKSSGLIFDVYTYPKFHFASFILNDVKSLNSHLLDRLQKTVIINDTNNYLQDVIKKAQALYAFGPQIIKKKQLNYLRHSLIGYLRKVKRSSSREENIIYVNRILDSLLMLNALLNGGWIDKRSEIVHSDFHKEFFLALNEFYVNNSVNEIIKITEATLSDSGPINFNINTSYCLPDLKDDQMVIGIANNINIPFFEKLFMQLKTLLSHQFIYFHKNDNERYPGVCYFIVLFNIDQQRKNIILNDINRFLLKAKMKLPKLNIIYPYNLSTDINYVPHPLATNLYYNKIFHLWEQMRNKKNTQQNLIYYYSATLSIVNEIEQKELKKYYKLLLRIWLVEVYDETSNNYNQLSLQVKNQLITIQNEYREQQSSYVVMETEINHLIRERIILTEHEPWADKLEAILPSDVIYNNYYFRTYNYINNLKECDIIDSIQFYKFQKVLNFFCEMICMPKNEKPSYAYRMFKAVQL